MNTYHASYRYDGSWGVYEYWDYIITANTESEALGFALEAEPDTHAPWWTISLIDTAKPGARYVYGSCS